MNRIALPASVVLVLVVGSVSSGQQQVVDVNFDATVATPTYTKKHPTVLFDEAHFNFHTTAGRYKSFADLIGNDGLLVTPNRAKFSKETLQGSAILIIANAMGAKEKDDPGAGNPAFTDAEADAVRDWVRNGGALLLITDLQPFGSPSEILAQRFGVEMSKGTTFDPAHSVERKPANLVFTRDDELIGDHPITQGRDDSEQIKRVITFGGQSLKGPEGSVAILKLADSAVDRVPPGNRPTAAAGRAQGLAFNFGKGRVVVMGEAGLLSAQLFGPNREPMGMNYPGIDNRQLALNIMHWLASTKEAVEAARVTLEGLITAEPVPEGYAVTRQELKDNGKVGGDLLLILKPGGPAKAGITVDRATKIETRAEKVTATKGYINGTSQALVGGGMKIVKQTIPDLATVDFAKPLVVDLTLEKPQGGEVLVELQIFFEKVLYQVQVIGEDKGEFEKLVKWGNSVKAAP